MAWLSGWDKRIKITVDESVLTDANDLTQFPLTLICKAGLSGIGTVDVSAIFDEVTTNGLKIAVTKADGETELYVEQELWDNGTESFVLHVSAPGWVIDSETDTDLYIYYDNDHADNTTYVGGVGSRTEVWDANYLIVQHMADETTATTTDSTSNNNDGTKSSANNPLEATGKIGLAQAFSSDYISMGDLASVAGLTTMTLEAWVNLSALTADGSIICKYGENQTSFLFWFDDVASGSTDTYTLYVLDDDSHNARIEGSTNAATTGWQYVAATFLANNANGFRLYVDGAEDANSPASSSTVDETKDVTAPLEIGSSHLDSSTRYFPGIIDEVRVSSTVRTAAWVKACYNS